MKVFLSIVFGFCIGVITAMVLNLHFLPLPFFAKKTQLVIDQHIAYTGKNNRIDKLLLKVTGAKNKATYEIPTDNEIFIVPIQNKRITSGEKCEWIAYINGIVNQIKANPDFASMDTIRFSPKIHIEDLRVLSQEPRLYQTTATHIVVLHNYNDHPVVPTYKITYFTKNEAVCLDTTLLLKEKISAEKTVKKIFRIESPKLEKAKTSTINITKIIHLQNPSASN